MHPRISLGLVLLLAQFVFSQAAETPSTTESEVRAAFLNLIDRPKVPLNPEINPLSSSNGVAKFHFTFSSEAEQRVPGILLKPESSKGRMAVVIALHGTGGNKNDGALRSMMETAVKAGCIGVAIDGRYHGERSKAGTGSATYNEAIVRTYQTGKEHPFFYDTVWDVMRLVDYLETRDDVDAKRIGLTGISKGGIETYLTAAADPRIAVAVPCIGVQSFRWGIDNGQWKARIATIQDAFDQAAAGEGIKKPGTDFLKKFYDRVVPGIYGQFDGPSMLPLIAPRPLMVINGDSDANTPMAGVRKSVEAARVNYHSANADEKFLWRIQENTGHAVTTESREAAVQWLLKWLLPGQ